MYVCMYSAVYVFRACMSMKSFLTLVGNVPFSHRLLHAAKSNDISWWCLLRQFKAAHDCVEYVGYNPVDLVSIRLWINLLNFCWEFRICVSEYYSPMIKVKATSEKYDGLLSEWLKFISSYSHKNLVYFIVFT